MVGITRSKVIFWTISDGLEIGYPPKKNDRFHLENDEPLDLSIPCFRQTNWGIYLISSISWDVIGDFHDSNDITSLRGVFERLIQIAITWAYVCIWTCTFIFSIL